jgi:hypothetical protein
VEGIRFIIDGDTARSLERYLPLSVDVDWFGVRVKGARTTCG